MNANTDLFGNVQTIEGVLKDLGFFVKVAEINIREGFFEYYLEIARGTDLKKLETHDRDLAIALASITGKVYWQIPIPGKNYIGLRVPMPTKEEMERIKKEEAAIWKSDNFRNPIAFAFYLIGHAAFWISFKILGK